MRLPTFSCAQSFFVDPSVVGGATHVDVSAIELFFQAKPDRTLNSSGIYNPGVTVYIVPTQFGLPAVEGAALRGARAEFDQIATTSDASQPTTFRFSTPVTVETGREQAVLVSFDGADDFVLWTSVAGHFLVNSKRVSPGSSGGFVGKYFEFATGAAGSSYLASWKPRPDVDLKIRVYAARYWTDGVPADLTDPLPTEGPIIRGPIMTDPVGNTNALLFPSPDVEYVLFDQTQSVKERFVGGQMAYQWTVHHPGGFANGSSSVSVATATGSTRVVANSRYPNGASFSWPGIFGGYSGTKYLVLDNGDGVDVRRVLDVVSNTVVELDESTSFTNAAAKFMVAPVGRVYAFNRAVAFGTKRSIITLADSSANATVRFVNNCVESVTVEPAGSGYSNSDVVYVTGFENVASKVSGGYVAVGNLATNATGGPVAVYMANLGCGFVNAAAVRVIVTSGACSSPTTNTSAGTGANLVPVIGATIKTEDRNNVFRGCQVVNFDVHDVTPYFQMTQPPGTSADFKVVANYYAEADSSTYLGYGYHLYDSPASFDVKLLSKTTFSGPRVPTYLSRSNEFVVGYANGAPNDRVSPLSRSNSVLLVVNSTSNSDYASVLANSVPSLAFSTYIVNDDYAGENTDQGAAWARGIATKIDFKRLSEDVIAYLDAWKPAGTDVQVYARLHHPADSEPIEDKDWTRLEKRYSANLASSPTNPADWVELTYGLRPCPNVDLTSAGTATATLNQSNLVGVGTNFAVDFAASDLVVVGNPLFPNNFTIDVVDSVVNSTVMTLKNPVSNADFAGSGLQVSRIRTYKHQGFNNQLRDNVSRYYSSSMVPFDGFDTMQLKIVLLTSSPSLVPRIDATRVAAVSA